MIKIYFVGNSPTMMVMMKVSELVGVDKVDNPDQADLVVIFGDSRDLERVYRRDKSFALIADFGKVPRVAAENVKVFPSPLNLPNYYEYISNLARAIEGRVGDVSEEQLEKSAEIEVELLPDAKKILIIDDSPKNLASAKRLLAGHHLIVIGGYEAAMEILKQEQFEIVLSDLYLPMSSKTLGGHAFRLGELVPYGFLLMIEAARCGATHVAIVTDLNHHADHFSAAFDHFGRFPIQIEGARARMFHARLLDDGSKNWQEALERLLRN